jgi:hypothetical protein
VQPAQPKTQDIIIEPFNPKPVTKDVVIPTYTHGDMNEIVTKLMTDKQYSTVIDQGAANRSLVEKVDKATGSGQHSS